MSIPQPTLIYRITHIQNVAWLLTNGLHCASSGILDPHFVSIWNADLIQKRKTRLVPIPPHGVLDDCVPFYFCTHSLMLYNIHTGHSVARVEQREVVYLVSSVQKLEADRIPFLFTDRHAYPVTAKYFSDPSQLATLDWELLRGRDFRRDPNRPDKVERRAAELLVHRRLPSDGLLGVACFDDPARARIQDWADSIDSKLPVRVRRDWYF